MFYTLIELSNIIYRVSLYNYFQFLLVIHNFMRSNWSLYKEFKHIKLSKGTDIFLYFFLELINLRLYLSLSFLFVLFFYIF